MNMRYNITRYNVLQVDGWIGFIYFLLCISFYYPLHVFALLSLLIYSVINSVQNKNSNKGQAENKDYSDCSVDINKKCKRKKNCKKKKNKQQRTRIRWSLISCNYILTSSHRTEFALHVGDLGFGSRRCTVTKFLTVIG